MIHCKVCGGEAYPENWPNGDSMIEHQLCFDCEFWRMQHQLDVEDRGEHNWAVIDGHHYAIEPDAPNSTHMGFGGQHFIIQWNDGTTKESKNLWHQGEIPKEWLSVFPNNAIFIKAEFPDGKKMKPYIERHSQTQQSNCYDDF